MRPIWSKNYVCAASKFLPFPELQRSYLRYETPLCRILVASFAILFQSKWSFYLFVKITDLALSESCRNQEEMLAKFFIRAQSFHFRAARKRGDGSLRLRPWLSFNLMIMGSLFGPSFQSNRTFHPALLQITKPRIDHTQRDDRPKLHWHDP